MATFLWNETEQCRPKIDPEVLRVLLRRDVHNPTYSTKVGVCSGDEQVSKQSATAELQLPPVIVSGQYGSEAPAESSMQHLHADNSQVTASSHAHNQAPADVSEDHEPSDSNSCAPSESSAR